MNGRSHRTRGAVACRVATGPVPKPPRARDGLEVRPGRGSNGDPGRDGDRRRATATLAEAIR